MKKELKVKQHAGKLVPDNDYTRNAFNLLKNKGAVINFEINPQPEKELLGVYQKDGKFYRRNQLYYVVPPATIKTNVKFNGGSKTWGIIDGLVKYCGFKHIHGMDHHKYYDKTEDVEVGQKTYMKLLKSGGKNLKVVIKKKISV